MRLQINLLVAEGLQTIKNNIAEDNEGKTAEVVQKIYKQFLIED